MALISCRKCGKEVSVHAKSCPHCGLKFPAKNYSLSGIESNLLTICAGISALWLLFVFVYHYFLNTFLYISDKTFLMGNIIITLLLYGIILVLNKKNLKGKSHVVVWILLALVALFNALYFLVSFGIIRSEPWALDFWLSVITTDIILTIIILLLMRKWSQRVFVALLIWLCVVIARICYRIIAFSGFVDLLPIYVDSPFQEFFIFSILVGYIILAIHPRKNKTVLWGPAIVLLSAACLVAWPIMINKSFDERLTDAKKNGTTVDFKLYEEVRTKDLRLPWRQEREIKKIREEDWYPSDTSLINSYLKSNLPSNVNFSWFESSCYVDRFRLSIYQAEPIYIHLRVHRRLRSSLP